MAARVASDSSRLELLSLAGLVSLGAAARIWQYAANSSLWLDEVSLALGIVHSDLTALLLAPLPFQQVAPKGFLLLQKISVLAFGPSDYALRLVPLICSLIALVAFAWLAKRMLTGVAPVAAVLLFASAGPLIAYTATVKQYAADVCVAVLLCALAWELASKPVTRRRAVRGALAGAVLVWFSQPAVLVLAAFGATFFGWSRRLSSSRFGPRRDVILLVAGWGVSSLAVTLVGFVSMTPETREYMHLFWADGFPPIWLSKVFETFWPWDRLMVLLGRASGGAQASHAYPFPAVFATLGALGLGLLWRQNRTACLLLSGPLVVTLIAALTRQYPFSDRLILFLVPSLFLAIAASAEGLRRLLWPISPVLATSITVGLLALGVYPVVASPPVYHHEHIKPALELIEAKRRPGDGIYVYYGAGKVTTFYASQFGLRRDELSVGGCHRGDTRRYLQELDAFRGRRVWVLITHAFPRYRERHDILSYLDTIGARKRELSVPSHLVAATGLPAEVYLYDVSDPARAATASSDTFELSITRPRDPRRSCGTNYLRSDFR